MKRSTLPPRIETHSKVRRGADTIDVRVITYAAPRRAFTRPTGA
jgi:hypothetical protein